MGLSDEQYNERAQSQKIKSLNRVVPNQDLKDDYVFISYKSEDWKPVLEDVIYKIQTKHGLNAYFDRAFASDNKSWLNQMKDAMENTHCKAVIAFVSPSYVESYATLIELLTTASYGVRDARDPKKELDVIPIIIEGRSMADCLQKNANWNNNEPVKMSTNETERLRELISDIAEHDDKYKNIGRSIRIGNNALALEQKSILRAFKNFFEVHGDGNNDLPNDCNLLDDLVLRIEKIAPSVFLDKLKMKGSNESEVSKTVLTEAVAGISSKNVRKQTHELDNELKPTEVSTSSNGISLSQSTNASKTYVEIIKRLIEENPSKVQRVLGKIVSINRHNFDSDANKVVKEITVNGVNYYVNTHSSTSAKIKQVEDLARVIKLEEYHSESRSLTDMPILTSMKNNIENSVESSHFAIVFNKELNENNFANLYMKMINEMCLNVSELNDLNPKIVSFSRLGFDNDANKQVRSFTVNGTELFVNVHSDTKTKIKHIASLSYEMGIDVETSIKFLDAEKHNLLINFYRKMDK